MACFNGLSVEQQVRLVVHGNLPFGYYPEGECPNGAECGIEAEEDTAPGSRFYCYSCAAKYLTHLHEQKKDDVQTT
jgi:hypothetical protein